MGRLEESKGYKRALRDELEREGIREKFRRDNNKGQQDVHVVVDVPQITEETTENSLVPRVMRRKSSGPSFTESLTGDHATTYAALGGLLILGTALAGHGIAIGATLSLLQAIHEYGFTQAALHVVSGIPAVEQFASGVGLDVLAYSFAKITRGLEKESE